LYSQVPVIAATGSCLEEAGGPNSIYVDPQDTDQLAIEIDRVMEDSKLQLEMKQKGLEYAKRFTSEKQANEVMNIYKELI
jgi:glycosyltransferase involved in cell wall biosynthesis